MKIYILANDPKSIKTEYFYNDSWLCQEFEISSDIIDRDSDNFIPAKSKNEALQLLERRKEDIGREIEDQKNGLLEEINDLSPIDKILDNKSWQITGYEKHISELERELSFLKGARIFEIIVSTEIKEV